MINSVEPRPLSSQHESEAFSTPIRMSYVQSSHLFSFQIFHRLLPEIQIAIRQLQNPLYK